MIRTSLLLRGFGPLDYLIITESDNRLVGSADKADTLHRHPAHSTIRARQHARNRALQKTRRTGVAKFDVSFFNAGTGDLQDVIGPVYGFSHFDRSSILGFGWKTATCWRPKHGTK